MIPVIRQQLFVSLARSAKLIAAPHIPQAVVPSHRKLKREHHPLHQYSLQNQRRIKRLREKKSVDTDIVHMLKQEVREHHVTRQQLLGALRKVQSEYESLKAAQIQKLDRQIALADIHESIVTALLFAKKLDQSDERVSEAVSRLEKLQDLVKKKLK